MDKLAKNRAGARANNSMDHNNKKYDDNAPQPQGLVRAALDELLQTECKLRAAIHAKQESKHQWRVREKGLWCSNWKLELENTKISEQTDCNDGEILAGVEKSEKDHDELKKYKSQNRQDAASFWTYFQEETNKYSHLLPNAHMAYNSDSLKQDITVARLQSKNFREKIARVEKHMDSLIATYGLAEHETNRYAQILKDFDVATKTVSDKSALLRATRSAEDNIDVLKLTVKQKKHDIAYLKNKSRKKY